MTAKLNLILLLLTGLLPIACGGPDESGAGLRERMRAGTFVYNLGAEPTTLDPAKATRFPDLRVVGQLLEPLVRIDAERRIVPGAAESWEISSDGLTYTFRLRPARWSNGDPVRSGDFAFAWRRVLDPATRAIMVNLLYDIQGARGHYDARKKGIEPPAPLGLETPDDRTLVVRLERPVPYFLSLTALEAFFPVHPASVGRHGEGAFRAGRFVSNGPYQLTEHRPRRRIVLERNPMWAGPGKGGANRIVLVMIENEFTEWTVYRRGEIDVTTTVHRSALTRLRSQPDFHSIPLVGTCYLAFHCERPPFDRAEVRRAFARALDRRQLVDYVTRGGEQPATALVPPGIHYGAEPRDFREEGGDLIAPVAASAAELASMRASLGELPRGLAYSFDSAEIQRSLAIALQMAWRERLGVSVDIEASPARVLAQSKSAGDFMIARASWFADYLDPTTFLNIFRSDSNSNPSRWSHPRYDELLDRAAATTDTAGRMALLHEAERFLLEQMPICPVYFYATAYLQRPGLAGIERNLLGRVNFSRAQWRARLGTPTTRDHIGY